MARIRPRDEAPLLFVRAAPNPAAQALGRRGAQIRREQRARAVADHCAQLLASLTHVHAHARGDRA